MQEESSHLPLGREVTSGAVLEWLLSHTIGMRQWDRAAVIIPGTQQGVWGGQLPWHGDKQPPPSHPAWKRLQLAQKSQCGHVAPHGPRKPQRAKSSGLSQLKHPWPLRTFPLRSPLPCWPQMCLSAWEPG